MPETTNDKFEILLNATEQLRQAIVRKGVSCPDTTPFENYPTKIEEILQVGSQDVVISTHPDVTSVGSTWLSSARHNGRYLYYNNSYLTNIDMSKLYGMGLTEATTTEYAFASCSNLASLPEFIYIPKVTNAIYMFQSCSNLKDCSGTTIQVGNNCNISYMFQSCSQMTKAPLILGNNNSSQNCNYTFSSCYKLDDIENICQSAFWPSNMEGMFANTPAAINSDLAQTLLDSMNLNYVNSASYCFQHNNYSSIKGISTEDDHVINYTLVFNTPSVRYFYLNYLFYSWNYHNYKPRFVYDFTSNCSGEAQYLFQEYGGSWDSQYYHPLWKIKKLSLPNIQYLRYAFQYCTFLEEIERIETSASLRYAEQMFYYCWRLKSIPLFNTSGMYSAPYMFYGCREITELPEFDFTSLQTAYYMFAECYKLKSIPQFNTPNLTSCYGMFQNCQQIEDIPAFDTSRCSDFQYMFSYCYALREVPALNMINCTYAYYMFQSCSNLEHIHCYNIKTNIDISSSTKFTREALLEIIQNLIDVGETRTLTMGSTNLAKLSAADIQIATAKNWTLV